MATPRRALAVPTALILVPMFNVKGSGAPAIIGIVTPCPLMLAQSRSASNPRTKQLIVLDIGNERDIEPAFATLVQGGAGALLVGAGAFLNSHREQLVALTTRHALPAVYAQRDGALAGGLMSYGSSNMDGYRQAGIYAGRILTGEKPADLPVIRSTKFDFVINLKTAKTLGLAVPDRVLALADEVIE